MVRLNQGRGTKRGGRGVASFENQLIGRLSNRGIHFELVVGYVSDNWGGVITMRSRRCAASGGKRRRRGMEEERGGDMM